MSTPAHSTTSPYDLIILGAGTAGLTAALYARRAGLSTLILESLAPGGQIVNTNKIENYPAAPHVSGADYAATLFSQAQELGAEVEFAEATSLELTHSLLSISTEDTTYHARSLIIATGCSHRQLDLPAATSLVGRGISYCATCDGAFYKGQEVAVVGGGELAVDDALYLAQLTSKVYLIHRRQQFRASASSVARLRSLPNVEFLLDANVSSLQTEDDKLSNATVTFSDGHTQTLPVSGLFVAIGHMPNTQLVKDALPLDTAGFIVANESCTTNIPGVFVAGDVRTKTTRQLVTAAADGATAALAASNYLHQPRS